MCLISYKLFKHCWRLSPEKADGHTSRIFDAVFHPQSNNEFISGGWDDTIQFWDIRQPQSIRYITGAHICGEGIDIHKSGRDVIYIRFKRNLNTSYTILNLHGISLIINPRTALYVSAHGWSVFYRFSHGIWAYSSLVTHS